MNIDEDKFSSNLIALARKVQAAFKSVIGGKPKIEQEGRYLLVSVAETDLDYVTQTMKGALPSNWKEFDVAADEEGTTFEYAPAQRIGAPFASVYAEDDGESSVALLGTYTDADLREGVLNVYQQSLMEKRSPGTLRGKILELRQAVGGENLYELGIMLGLRRQQQPETPAEKEAREKEDLRQARNRRDAADAVREKPYNDARKAAGDKRTADFETKHKDELETFDGKKGVWRTTKEGRLIFIPSDGSEPRMDSHIKKASKQSKKGWKGKATKPGYEPEKA